MSVGSVEIGPVQDHEYRALVELFRQLGARYHCDIDDPRTRDVFSLYVEGVRKVGLVARLEGRVVGTILYDLTPLFAPTHVHARGDGIIVDANFRGRGIGRQLWLEALRSARERRVTSFLAKASDPDVIRRYRGFDEFKERGVYFYYDPPPLDAERGW